MVSQLLLYSLKSAFALIVMYLPYLLLLRKESFYCTNRKVLLVTLALSLLLPLCNISWLSMDNVTVVHDTQSKMIEAGFPVQMAEENVLEVTSLELSSQKRMPWFEILAIFYLTGMVLSVIYRGTQLGIMSHALKHRNKWTKQENGITICCRSGRFIPYSWMRSIVISEEDWNEGAKEIVLHETGHIVARHSYDMLLLMACQAVQWYNPFVWMIDRSLTDVHEFEADDYVLNHGVDMKDYMILLVNKIAETEGYSFVNGLSRSTLNKRILMMKKTVPSSAWRKAKMLYLLPVSILILSVFATPELIAPVEKAIESLSNQDVQPEYPGGGKALMDYINENIRYPEQLKKDGVQGRVVMSFIVEVDGSISNIETLRSSNEEFEAEAIRVLQGMPKWKPGMHHGEPVNVMLVVPVNFRLSSIK